MKKITSNYAEWLCRRSRNHHFKSVSRAGRKQHRSKNLTRELNPLRFKTSIISVPEQLLGETYEQRQKIAQILETAMRVLSKPGTRVKFDFSRVKKLFPGGTLILVAYLELLLINFPSRISARCPPKSMAAQLLGHFGKAAELGINPSSSAPTHESVVNWHYLTGTGADGGKVSELLAKYRTLTSAELPENLYDVLAEALTNTRHHAYPEQSSTPTKLRRWWLFSRYVEPNGDDVGNLYIAIYDLGVGIQHTMRRQLNAGEVVLDKTNELLKWIGLPNSAQVDRLLLEEAIDHTRSSTGLPFRGKGLPEMRQFVMSTETGRLYIVSGRAQYSCIAATSTSSASGCKKPFLGTLILWSIPLRTKETRP